MDHLLLARASLSLLCILQAVATVAIDFSRTHATNPLWPGHARFHVVWQSSTVVLLSALELVLLWRPGPNGDARFYLAAVLASLSPFGFLAAFATRKLFAGTLTDPNGIPPARLEIFGTVQNVDMNLVAVILAIIALSIITAIYRW